MEVEGVVGGRNELVNAFMACGTYYEVSEIGEKSELDDRGVCSWANSSNPDRVEGKEALPFYRETAVSAIFNL